MSRREKKLINLESTKKKIIIGVAFLLIILCIILLTWKLVSLNKASTTNLELDTNEGNIMGNEVQDNVENVVIENNETQVNEVNPILSSEEKSLEEIENEEDKKEKAIALTKNKWGEDNNVYFTFDSIDENENYIVYIREKATTHALARAIVNVKAETCTLE